MVSSASYIKDLRAVFDKIVVNIRALNALGISSDQFGPMLSPVVMKMLPNDLKSVDGSGARGKSTNC